MRAGKGEGGEGVLLATMSGVMSVIRSGVARGRVSRRYRIAASPRSRQTHARRAPLALSKPPRPVQAPESPVQVPTTHDC